MRTTHAIVERAEALVPLLEQHRPYGEAHARLAPEVVAACRDAGMYGLYAPVEVGGEEAPLPDVFAAMVTVAAADPSAAWLMVNSAALAEYAPYLDPARWPEVFTRPLGPYGLSAAVTGTLEPTEGGYLLNGTWPLVTGVLDATWATLNCHVISPDGRRPVRAVIVRTADLSIDPIWENAVAMRGTGSHQVRAEAVPVPADLVVNPAAPPQFNRALQRVPFFVRAGVLNSAVPIGILRSAVAAASAELAGKVSTIFGTKAADSTALLELVADASLSLAFLERGVLAAIEELWQYAEGDQELPISLRATVAGAPFHAVEVARDLTSRLYARSSRAAFFAGHPLEGAMRNIHAVAYGLEPLRPIHHAAGRVQLGLDPNMTI